MPETIKLSGTIVKGVGGLYTIRTADGTFVMASPRGILRKRKIVPTVGDRVDIEASGDPDVPFIISDVLPRKNLLIRPSISNVDVLILTISTQKPVPYFEMLDKMLILCIKNSIRPVIWITKMDLDPDEGENIRTVYEKAGFDVLCSAESDAMNDKLLQKYFDGNTVGFAGQSGVGKSTLCNKITGISEREVGMVSERNNSGKHTTRHVELFPMGNGFLIDSPGFTNLDILMTDVGISDIMNGYPELTAIEEKCHFDDCRHVGELGCRIPDANMDSGRLDRYRLILRQVEDRDNNRTTGREKNYGKL